MSSAAKAAVVIALDEVRKVRAALAEVAGTAVTVNVLRDAVAGLPELKQVVVEIQERAGVVIPTLAKGKSYIREKDDHLILVYSDGYEEDVGKVGGATMMVRHTGGGGDSSRAAVAGAVQVQLITTSTSFVVTPTQTGKLVVLADATAAPVIVTLPNAINRAVGDDVTVVRKNVSGFSVFVAGLPGQPICGSPDTLELNAARTGNTPSAEMTPIEGGWWIT